MLHLATGRKKVVDVKTGSDDTFRVQVLKKDVGVKNLDILIPEVLYLQPNSPLINFVKHGGTIVTTGKWEFQYVSFSDYAEIAKTTPTSILSLVKRGLVTVYDRFNDFINSTDIDESDDFSDLFNGLSQTGTYEQRVGALRPVVNAKDVMNYWTTYGWLAGHDMTEVDEDTKNAIKVLDQSMEYLRSEYPSVLGIIESELVEVDMETEGDGWVDLITDGGVGKLVTTFEADYWASGAWVLLNKSVSTTGEVYRNKYNQRLKWALFPNEHFRDIPKSLGIMQTDSLPPSLEDMMTKLYTIGAGGVNILGGADPIPALDGEFAPIMGWIDIEAVMDDNQPTWVYLNFSHVNRYPDPHYIAQNLLDDLSYTEWSPRPLK